MTSELLTRLAAGIIAGEAMSAMNADYRMYQLPPKRVTRVRTLGRLADDTRTTTVVRPFTHAAPPSVLQPGAGENIEWFAFSARQHARGNDLAQWITLAETEPAVRARIGTKHALQNLANGALPPQSGHDNPHYFDDIAMTRALGAVAIVADADDARLAARDDASVTHSLDGVWCAEAVAVLASALVQGADRQTAVSLALDVLPTESWSRRMADAALAVAAESASVFDRARRLSIEVGDWIYSYPIAAPETLAFLLAHLSASVSADDMMAAVVAQPRNAATLPAVAGGIAALSFSTDWIPVELRGGDAPLTGLSIPEFAGRSVSEVVATDS